MDPPEGNILTIIYLKSAEIQLKIMKFDVYFGSKALEGSPIQQHYKI